MERSENALGGLLNVQLVSGLDKAGQQWASGRSGESKKNENKSKHLIGHHFIALPFDCKVLCGIWPQRMPPAYFPFMILIPPSGEKWPRQTFKIVFKSRGIQFTKVH